MDSQIQAVTRSERVVVVDLNGKSDTGCKSERVVVVDLK